MRIFIHDSSESFCRLIAFWLESHTAVQLVGVAHDRDTAVTRVAASQPDLVVLDARIHSRVSLLPDELRRIVPAAAIVVYSAHTTRIARRVAPEADAYVQKRGESRELIEVLRDARSRASSPP